jgi:RimK-like ATP-grasp domain
MEEAVVLAISDHTDMHIPLVGRHLEAMGIPLVQFNTADFPLRVELTHIYERETRGSLLRLPGLQPLDCKKIRSVWYRRPEAFLLPVDLPPGQKDFAAAECREAIWGLYENTDCLWVDWPATVREASNKPHQLDLAQQLGFQIPRTLITNDASLVRSFYEACKGKAIYKTLSRPAITHTKQNSSEPTIDFLVYTTPLEMHHLDFLDSIRFSPCLFQEYVPKRIELRITVVGDKVYAAEIHSQDNPGTINDWRHYKSGHTAHQPHYLSADITELCIRLLKQLGLNFGAIDMIVTPNNQYVFLEINPAGQYGWVEQLTDLPISLALAKLLAGARPEQWNRTTGGT